MAGTQVHRKKGLIPIFLNACFLSWEVCVLQCKTPRTPSVTMILNWKVKKKSFAYTIEHLPAGWCWLLGPLQKQNSVSLDGVSNCHGSWRIQNVKELTASHPHSDTGQVQCATSPHTQPDGPQDSGLATNNRPALGRKGPSPTREANLKVSSALPRFLCQGREICQVVRVQYQAHWET